MSWIGNIVAGVAALQIGKANQNLFNAQAAMTKYKAELDKRIYENVDRPRLVKAQSERKSNLKVSLLNTGAEMRLGETTGLVFLDQMIEDATDLAISDYTNLTVAYNNTLNQSLLLEAQGDLERFKGKLTAASEFAKAGGKMYSNKQETNSILG